MATDDQGSPPRAQASEQDWAWVESAAPAYQAVSVRCLLDVRDRVAALEAAARGVADHVPDARKMVTPTPTPTPTAAPASGVTEEELRQALEAAVNSAAQEVNVPRGIATARHLLNHPRIGPLLRGEGGKRVVLPEVPTSGIAGMAKRQSRDPREWLAGWAAARAELARQQGEQP